MLSKGGRQPEGFHKKTVYRARRCVHWARLAAQTRLQPDPRPSSRDQGAGARGGPIPEIRGPVNSMGTLGSFFH